MMLQQWDSLKRMNNCKFLGSILLFNTILPHLNALSKLFQKDHTCFTSIRPALEATKAALTAIRNTYDIEQELALAIRADGAFCDLELELSEADPVRKFLTGLLTNYTCALERNLDRRFLEASPVLQAFSVFDPTALPDKRDIAFTEYGQHEMEVLSNQFHFDTNETLAQWQNFKYQMADWNIPEEVLRGNDISPTHCVLRKLVKEQAVYKIGFNRLVELAQICLTQPLSNAVVERAASEVKRVKTRLRSLLKNDMLTSLLHITLNGPHQKSVECHDLLMEATNIWRKTHVRNLPPLKRLPLVGGSQHTDSLCYPMATAECGVQTDCEGLQLNDEDSYITTVEELDQHVQVQVQQVTGDEDCFKNALLSLDMAESDLSGVEFDDSDL